MKGNQHFNSVVYSLYLLILVWSPLPLGSNRDWALGILMVLVLLLAAGLLVESALKRCSLSEVIKPYFLPLGLFFLVCVWVVVQGLELPESMVSTLSPVTAQVWSDAGLTAQMITLSIDPGTTHVKAIFTCCLFLFSVATLLVHHNRERVRTTGMVIVYSGLFQALYGSFMTLSGLEYGFFFEKEFYRGVATGTFVNRNHLAGYLEMSLAMGIGLLVASLGSDRTRGWRAHLRGLLDTLLGPKMRMRVYLALMVIALVLTRSRMGNTAFFSSLAVCGLLLMVAQRKLHKGAIILFASMMLVDFLIVGQWFGFDELAERLENTSTQTESRDEVAADTLDIIRDYPLTGTGLGTFYVAYSRYQQPGVTVFYDHAHNDYLEFLSDLGAIGYVPLAILVMYSVFMALMALFRRRDTLARGVAFGALMAMVSLLIHSVVDFNLQMPANALLFVVMMSLAWKARYLPSRSH